MSEEIKELFWELKQYLVPYSPNWYSLCETEQYILNLEQENKELKEQLKGTTHCYDEEEHKRLVEENKKVKETLENNTKVNLADHKYASEMEDKYLVEHNILTELEKWLKIRIKEETWAEWHDGLCECLDKLQELKIERCNKDE